MDRAKKAELAENYFKKWQRKNLLTAIGVDQTDKTEMLTLCQSYNSSSRYFEQAVRSAYAKKAYKKPSDFMKDRFGRLVRIFVPKEYTDDYYSIIDDFPGFSYTVGIFRRSLRTKDFACHIDHAIRLMYSYMSFGIYETDIAGYLRDQLNEELLDFKHSGFSTPFNSISCFDDMLAARINAGDQGVIDAIRECLLSENNTVTVTTDIIRAITKCRSCALHQLLADFLVAARLSEGVRQAICESADEGNIDCFLTILRVIEKENLTRFAAVKRAIGTWTGFIPEEDPDRIIAKIMPLMISALENRDKAEALTRTDDSIQIMLGLWALGVRDYFLGTRIVEDFALHGSKVQKLTASYYCRMLQNYSLSGTVAAYIIENNSSDQELAAAYLPSYLHEPGELIRSACFCKNSGSYYLSDDGEYEYREIPLTDLFSDDRDGEKTRKHYGIMKQNLTSLTKRKVDYSPCIFPWYTVSVCRSDFIMRMAVMAYALKDQTLIDETCTMVSDIDAEGTDRRLFIRLLLHDPKTKIQRETLLSAVCDKESYARNTAYSIIRKLELRPQEYEALSDFLKYKSEDVRRKVMDILKEQPGPDLEKMITDLLASGNEQKRLAAFDMLKTEYAENKSAARRILAASGIESSLTAQEQVLWNATLGAGEKPGQEAGYGLYDPKTADEIPPAPADDGGAAVRAYFNVTRKELDKVFSALMDVIRANGSREYTRTSGETWMLINGLYSTSYDPGKAYYDMFPFKELWQDFYQEHVKSEKMLMNMVMATESGYSSQDIQGYDDYLLLEKKLLPYAGSDYSLPEGDAGQKLRRTVETAVSIMRSLTGASLPQEVACSACLFMTAVPAEKRWFRRSRPSYQGIYCAQGQESFYPFNGSQKMVYLVSRLTGSAKADKDVFYALRRMDNAFRFQKNETNKRSMGSQKLGVYSFIQACTKGMISRDYLYRYLFEELTLTEAMGELAVFSDGVRYFSDYRRIEHFVRVDWGTHTVDKDNDFFRLGRELYDSIQDLVLDRELNRGDSPTEFSMVVPKLRRLYGVGRLGQILTALGSDTLDRSTYYCYGYSGGKRESHSHLLQICYPDDSDTAEDLKTLHIREDRLIEVAMYAPQWLDLIEKTLDCDGFRSGCYYFMAHMNESFDDRKKAMIAKFTPLTAEELNDGCFDLNWFFDAYGSLGDKMFRKLYAAAKYISDGSKHSRARKYADAALGLVDRSSLEAAIADKRNKDLLMSLGLLPVADQKDILHRYEFIQKFLKESRQFGAQRRASEQKACETALKNLASRAGYADSLRLTLAMETALIRENAAWFGGISQGGCTCTIEVSEDGTASLAVEKSGRKLKSLPPELKKNETVLAMKEFVTKLRQQYSRSVKMFENSMEEREAYTAGELQGLCTNPVIAAILSKLFYIKDGSFYGLRQDGSFYSISADGNTQTVSDSVPGEAEKQHSSTLPAGDVQLRIAHPYDMYVTGMWSELQKTVFDWAKESRKYQPFKQVFRELYTKLPEEKDQFRSRMFAGNQIQPQRTVAALKNRRWVADYENGLQKIYYKDNVIAEIYALADWFSPADIEAPTLEYVVFSNRKTFRELPLSEVPEIIYSEVMRDVDLAVSVAHAGGVDPETSHSTIEMRKVIIGFNLQLFKLINVKLEGTHAVIEGTYGSYSIHLGSGIIHKLPGLAVNVLPVHSQSRGRIFLPFLDEDPKTAEILSKILLFADDRKIKDPYILRQIM